MFFLPSLVVAIKLSGSTCEKQQYDELSDDTNDMDVVEVDLSPGLLAGSHLPPWPALLDGGGTISMTTIRKIARVHGCYCSSGTESAHRLPLTGCLPVHGRTIIDTVLCV
jgi:hypothetical protein